MSVDLIDQITNEECPKNHSSYARILDDDFLLRFPLELFTSDINYGSGSILSLLNHVLSTQTCPFVDSSPRILQQDNIGEVAVTDSFTACISLSAIEHADDTIHDLQDSILISSQYQAMADSSTTYVDSNLMPEDSDLQVDDDDNHNDVDDEFPIPMELKSYHRYLDNDFSVAASPSKSMCAPKMTEDVAGARIAVPIEDDMEGFITSFNNSTTISSSATAINYDYKPLMLIKQHTTDRSSKPNSQTDKTSFNSWLFQVNYRAY
jgi:hypothetical protein